MSPKKLPADLRNDLNKVAFKYTSTSHWRDLSPIIFSTPPDRIAELIPDAGIRFKIISDIALNETPEKFKQLLSHFADDEHAIRAVLDGFKRDESFNNQPDFDDRFGPSKDYAALEKKRAALRAFVLEADQDEPPASNRRLRP